jgi:hypothetical protein
VLVTEFSHYVFSPQREGDIALHRGSGNGLAPILLAAAEETSLDCVARLEHEYALKGEFDADWAARPIALTHYNNRLTLMLEDPGGATVGSSLVGRWTCRISCASRSLSRRRSAGFMSEVLSIRTSSRRTFSWMRQAAAYG